jgi:D-glycero-D-manno-heptose 1,7-bisphosphate phosphatase
MIPAKNDFAVFVDRDGTINVDVDFLTSPSQLQLIPRSAEAIKELNDLGIPVVVITNQSGIARGLISEDDLRNIHVALDEMLKQYGASVSAYYYCPHHPDGEVAQYAKECDCRKPKPGMLFAARNDFGYNLQRSFVIGDKVRDVEAGKNVGAVAIQVSTGYGELEKDLCADIRDYYAIDLFDAVQFIKSKLKQ